MADSWSPDFASTFANFGVYDNSAPYIPGSQPIMQADQFRPSSTMSGMIRVPSQQPAAPPMQNALVANDPPQLGADGKPVNPVANATFGAPNASGPIPASVGGAPPPPAQTAAATAPPSAPPAAPGGAPGVPAATGGPDWKGIGGAIQKGIGNSHFDASGHFVRSTPGGATPQKGQTAQQGAGFAQRLQQMMLSGQISQAQAQQIMDASKADGSLASQPGVISPAWQQ